jgi:hypothetical protein
MFHVGQLVVCVDLKFCINEYVKALEKGRIYTIRGFATCPYTGANAVYVDEVVNGIHPAIGLEFAYWRGAFRPTAKTDISIFEAMLSPTKADA